MHKSFILYYNFFVISLLYCIMLYLPLLAQDNIIFAVDNLDMIIVQSYFYYALKCIKVINMPPT